MNVALTQPELEASSSIGRISPSAKAVEDVGYTAGYIRLTREESLKKGLSAPAQRADIADYVRRSDLPELKFYEEIKAVGGHVPWDKRGQGSRLIADIKAGRVTHVVVRDMDRLIRDTLLWIQLSKLCLKHGVTIHTLSGPLLSNSPTDKFATTVRAAACELEKDQVSDRVKRCKRQMAKQGKHLGGPPPFGYTSQARRFKELVNTGIPEDEARIQAEMEFPQKGWLYKDEVESKVVRLIFDWYVIKRWGCRRICNELNSQGYRRRSGRLWHPDKVRRIINDPVIAGFISYDEARFETGYGVRTPKQLQNLYSGKHEAIVSKELWDRAQQIKRSNTCHHLGKGQACYAKRKYTLSGVIRCACGTVMTVSAANAGKSYGYYQCRKRKYHGPDAIGGCSFPRINTNRVHEAFWERLSELICGPKLIDRVYQAAKRIIAEQAKVDNRHETAQRRTEKIKSDITLWYARHDLAKSDVEKEAAWRRIVELTNKIKELKGRRKTQPKKPKPKRLYVTKKAVAKYLESMNSFVGKTDDKGKAFVQSLVEHHGLAVQMQDEMTIVISLKLRPPGADGDLGSEYVVPLKGEARMRMDQITTWVVQENQNGHKCKCGCGKTIEVVRGHYWRGIPEFHSSCRHKGMQRKRAELARGYYTGTQAAEKLGIGRTTLGRWLRKGKLPKPEKSISGMLLFDRTAIDQLVNCYQKGLDRSFS